MVEPAEHEVVVPLHCYRICLGRAVGCEVVPAVLERDASATFELLVIPLCDLGVCEECIVTAGEPGSQPARDVVVCGIIFTGRVGCILPVTVLRFVDGEPVLYEMVISLDDIGSVVEEIIDYLSIGPSAISVERIQRGNM
jgi:hypothetical protein